MTRWTQKHIDQLQPGTASKGDAPKKKHKFGATRTQVNGVWFDSKKESETYKKLLILEQAGMITDLRLQVPFVLVPKNGKERAVKYVADFTFIENGLHVVADAKSEITRKNRAYIIKRKLMLSKHGVKIKEL